MGLKKFRDDVPLSLQSKQSSVSKFFDRFSIDVTKLFERRRGPQLARTVYFGLPLPSQAWAPTKHGLKQIQQGVPEEQVSRHTNKKVAQGWEYPSNQVITSKYNLLTFLPRNLLEQFRRVANIFFLILVILQFFPRFSNVSPALAALPLLVVLGITALKDGYEDLKRHQSDRAMNTLPVRVLHADGFHNPNMTETKERIVSLKTFGLGFLTANRTNKSQRSDNEALEAEAEGPKRHASRHWWGAKKVKKPPTTAPGGGSVEKATEEGAQEKRPNIQPRETEYDEDAASDESPYGNRDGRPRWKDVSWEDLKVGDFVKLTNNEAVPADIIICATSEEEDVAYVETKNLDGETNLKSRHAVPEMTHLKTAKLCTEAKFVVEADAPTVDMFKYNATVSFHDGRKDKDASGNLRVPVTLNTLLLRGTVLRNTDWVIGVVIASGLDTKIVMNSGGTPSKRSKVERQMNPMVFVNLFLLALMCIMCAVGDAILGRRYYNENAYWGIYADLSDDNPNINPLVSFANAMITFQNIVPISLYISIEFVKLMQAFFIWADDDTLYAKTGRRTMARSWNLSDDLGQVQYIFSDKTGTLTQNVMQFQHCTIGGKVYKGDGKKPDNIIVEKDVHSETSDDSSSTKLGQHDGAAKDHTYTPKVKLADEVAAPFHDSQIDADLADHSSSQARLLFGFFVNLALCHTVLAADDGEGNIQYKAQSPDEAALVQAAADVGFVFLGRDRNLLKISTPADPEPVEYELLNVIEFSSARKRMSVIIRKVDDSEGIIYVLMKGADNVIFERLAPGQDEIRMQTDDRLDEFANEGLRTLTLAYREIDEAAYQAWEREYIEASTALTDREEQMEAVADKIEREATLLGATAIEDKLQDGVPECLADLKRAGIKVWVCTGDKLETAVAIGKSSNLLTPEMNMIIVRGGAITEARSAYSQLRAALIDFFNAENIVLRVEELHAHAEEMSENKDTSGTARPPAHKRRSMGAMSQPSDLVGADNGSRSGGFGLVIDGSALRHAFEEPLSKELLLELSTRCSVVICCRASPLQKAQVVRLIKDGLGSMCLGIGDGANDVSMIQAADVGVGVAGEEGLQAVNSSDYSIGQFRYLKRLLLVHGTWSYMRNGNMICNFFYKEIIGIGVLFFFQFYCAFSTTTVYEYTYILFWNVFWTLLPVLAIGVQDRAIEQEVLMQVPELYRYGRQQHFFGMIRFLWYMIDGIYQSAICFFFVLYAYDTISTRSDGWSVGLYEFSTLMAIAAVFAANFYNGLNTHTWTAWVFASVIIGNLLIFLYTVIYSAIKPGWIWTYVFGNNIYLLTSPIFWFGWVFCVIVALTPRYIVRYVKEMYMPTDFDILKIVGKYDKKHDYYHDPLIPGGYQAQHYKSADHRDSQLQQPRLPRTETDMSGLAPVSSRGFNFDQADGIGEVAVGRPLRTYTSNSLHNSEGVLRTSQTRPRSGSVRRVAEALGFPRRTGSSNMSRKPSRLFGKTKSPSKLNQEVRIRSPSTSDPDGNTPPTTARSRGWSRSSRHTPSEPASPADPR